MTTVIQVAQIAPETLLWLFVPSSTSPIGKESVQDQPGSPLWPGHSRERHMGAGNSHKDGLLKATSNIEEIESMKRRNDITWKQAWCPLVGDG